MALYSNEELLNKTLKGLNECQNDISDLIKDFSTAKWYVDELVVAQWFVNELIDTKQKIEKLQTACSK